MIDSAASLAYLAGSSFTLGLQFVELRFQLGDLFGVFLDGGAEDNGIFIQLFALGIEVPVMFTQTDLQFVDRCIGRGDLAVEFADFQQFAGLVRNILCQLAADLGCASGQFCSLVGDDLCQFSQFVDKSHE